MRISDWSSDVCSSDLVARRHGPRSGARLLDRALVTLGVQELPPHIADDALPARRAFIVVVVAPALGIFAAGHLEALDAAGDLHDPDRLRPHRLHHHRTAGKDRRRTRPEIDRLHTVRQPTTERHALSV